MIASVFADRKMGRVILLILSVALATAGVATGLQIRQGFTIGTCTMEQILGTLFPTLDANCSTTLFAFFALNVADENLDAINSQHLDLYVILCEPSCGGKVAEFYKDCGAEEEAKFGDALCAKNENGDLCYKEVVLAMEDSDLVNTECLPVNATSCSEDCKDALQTFKTTVGCCLNTFFNGTIDQSVHHENITSYELWSMCDVATPGFCAKPFESDDNHSLPLAASVTIVAGIPLMLLLFLLQ